MNPKDQSSECEYCGRNDGCDCVERVNCKDAGKPGHRHCGKLKCGCPVFTGCECGPKR